MLSSILGSLSTVQIRLFTLLRGRHVGTDAMGNRYYSGRPRRGTRRERRWVIYAGEPDASKVPPQWHGWLHRQTDEPPVSMQTRAKPWQKEHKPNMTGTDQAYFPPGHILKGSRRDRATGDYEAWTPGQD